MKKITCWLIVTLICGILFFPYKTNAQNSDELSQDLIDFYTEQMIRKTKIIGNILSRIADNPQDKKIQKVGKRKLDEIFESWRSEIFHSFHHGQSTQAYLYSDFVEELISSRWEYVSLSWHIVGGAYLMLNGNQRPIKEGTVKNIYDSVSEKWKYKNWTINVDNSGFLKNKGEASSFPYQFSKTVYFDLFKENNDNEWRLRINRIKSSDNLMAISNGDQDGDGVPDKRDQCMTIKGDPNCFGCPFEDEDGDGICDLKDKCLGVLGDGPDGCPTKPEGTIVIKGTKIFAPPLPSIMDYKLIKLDGRLKGKPHWLWAGGVLGSWGLSGYYFSECNQSYKGCKIPKEFGNGNFASYRQAKLDRQNAVIFATLGATIWLVDIIQVAAKRRKLKKKGSKDFGQIDFFLDTQSLPSSTAGYTPIVGFRYQW